jgi:hypothetical protein
MSVSPKKEFEFREKLESWVEGVFDTFAAFIKTVLIFNFRPFKSREIVRNDSYQEANISQPGIFMILCYVLMLLMIKDIDFNDPVFSYNLAALLNAFGALEEIKSLSIEKVILAILPAIGFLMFCVYVSSSILFIFGEKADTNKIRRGYCYILGHIYLLVGVACLTYRLLVKPLSIKSWWIGLPIHILSMWPMFGGILLTLLLFPTESVGAKQYFGRNFARSLPWTILILVTWYFTGSFGFMDYRKAS